MFAGLEFKNSDAQKKKEFIGNVIYEKVEALIGSEKAPKITGMIIGLSDSELYQAVNTLSSLEAKVKMADEMLTNERKPA